MAVEVSEPSDERITDETSPCHSLTRLWTRQLALKSSAMHFRGLLIIATLGASSSAQTPVEAQRPGPSESIPRHWQCIPQEFSARLTPSDRAYGHAIGLERSLLAHGFTVRCVLRSKMDDFLEDIQGAALFRTNRGSFEALFMSHPEHVQISESRHGKLYDYEVRPRNGHEETIGGTHPIYFLKLHNCLLVTGDAETADALNTLRPR